MEIPAAVQVCQAHYQFKDRSSCFRCPIQMECQSSPGHGQEELDAWRAKVEAKAQQALHTNRRSLEEAQMGDPGQG